jgi:serine/threonine protein phosphatase PrpC
MSLTLRYGVRSDVGHVREGNEDAGYAGPRLVAIADGMGGAVAGEVASRTVIGRLAGLEDDDLGPDVVGALSDAVRNANGDLGDLVDRDPSLAGMGTTITALLAEDDRLALVHVGDSRCYLFRDGVLTQVTRDHTLVQELVDAGEISEEEAAVHPKRNIITRVLDGRGTIELDVSVRAAQRGDRYLLCSDGLSGYVSPETLADAVALPDPQDAADRLVDLALRAGGVDNVTAVVADIVEGPEGSSRTFAPATTGRPRAARTACAARRSGSVCCVAGSPPPTPTAAGRAGWFPASVWGWCWCWCWPCWAAGSTCAASGTSGRTAPTSRSTAGCPAASARWSSHPWWSAGRRS